MSTEAGLLVWMILVVLQIVVLVVAVTLASAGSGADTFAMAADVAPPRTRSPACEGVLWSMVSAPVGVDHYRAYVVKVVTDGVRCRVWHCRRRKRPQADSFTALRRSHRGRRPHVYCSMNPLDRRSRTTRWLTHSRGGRGREG